MSRPILHVIEFILNQHTSAFLSRKCIKIWFLIHLSNCYLQQSIMKNNYNCNKYNNKLQLWTLCQLSKEKNCISFLKSLALTVNFPIEHFDFRSFYLNFNSFLTFREHFFNSSLARKRRLSEKHQSFNFLQVSCWYCFAPSIIFTSYRRLEKEDANAVDTKLSFKNIASNSSETSKRQN